MHSSIDEYMNSNHKKVLESLHLLISKIEEVKNEDFAKLGKIWTKEKGIADLIMYMIKVDRSVALVDRASSQKHKINITKKAQQQFQDNEESLVKQEQENENEQEIHVKSPSCQEIKHQEHEPVKIENTEDDKLNSVLKTRDNQFEYPDLTFNLKSREKVKEYSRGPYKNYSKEMKEKIVDMYLNKEFPLAKLSKEYQIPIKNIKRWAMNGVDRKGGAGRKRLDPDMEKTVISEIYQNYELGQELLVEQIRRCALKLSNKADFKASKGWVAGFIDRYRLHTKFKLV